MLQLTVDWLFYSLLRLNPEAPLVQAAHFFIYDSVKILLLLFMMMAVIGFLRTFIPQRKMRQWLTRRLGLGNFFAACFGAVTPFCSCSSIPIFFGLLNAGVPLGVGFSFLVASPLINEYLVVLMLGFFGWRITLLYVVSGLAIGVAAGLLIGRFQMERFLVPDFVAPKAELEETGAKKIHDRLLFGWSEAVSITGKIWHWVLLGVAIGALIHNFVPEEAIHRIISSVGVFSVPAATLIGVPLYGNCAAIVPVAVVLFQKGIPLGTALAFMMATAALSLPEAVLLRRAMKLELIAVFFGVTTAAIMLTGLIFNWLQKLV